MTAHLGDGPVTLFEIMLNATGGAAGNGIFQQRMVRNDSEAIVFLLDFTDETGQERLNQGFWFCAFAIFFRMDHRDDTVAMHHFFHLRRRNEVALLSVHFEEAKALFRALNDPFRARRLGMHLLFKLR